MNIDEFEVLVKTNSGSYHQALLNDGQRLVIRNTLRMNGTIKVVNKHMKSIFLTQFVLSLLGKGLEKTKTHFACYYWGDDRVRGAEYLAETIKKEL